MFNQILLQIQEKVRRREYVLTLHAENEMVKDGLTIFDVENVLSTGQIVKLQRDIQTDEWKYLVGGQHTGQKLLSS